MRYSIKLSTFNVCLTSCLISSLGALLLLTGCSSNPPQAQSSAVLFEGARLVSGEGAVENSAFLVENGKFTKGARKAKWRLRRARRTWTLRARP